jgi:hypothetical protein
MLRDLLSKHLSEVEAVVRKLKEVYVERYEEEILTDNRVNLRIRIRFKSGYLLELNEANMVEESAIIRLYYRYHFQDEKHRLVFRYDNAPHFPGFENFPHHKHLPDKVTDTIASSILNVIEEANDVESSDRN